MDYDDDEEDAVGLRPDGSPDPAYAAALGLIPAPAARRSLSFALDAAIGAVLLVPALIGSLLLIGHIVGGAFEAAQLFQPAHLLVPFLLYAIGEGLLIVYVLVQVVLHGLLGRTIGKSAFGIRSVRATTFTQPGFWRAALRALVLWAAFVIVPVVGAIPFLLSPLWDTEHRGRGWLDRMAGNWLVDVRVGIDPFDAKAMRTARRRVAAPVREEAAPLPSLATRSGEPTFVPGTRSSSGVIGVGRPAGGAVGEPWSPPEIGPAAEAIAPQTPVTEQHSAPQASVAQQPAPRPPAQQPSGATQRAVFAFDDGTSLLIDAGGLIGRNPQPLPGEQVRYAIPLQDPALEISKTHAEFGLGPDGVWLVDRSSANGTWVVLPSGDRMGLGPGTRYPVPWGSTVELGGRTFRVLSADAAGQAEAHSWRAE